MENRAFLDRVQATPGKTDEVPSREIKISGKPIPEAVLDDLCARFLLNIPECERDNMIRLMFQVELAHWFYIDFHRVQNTSLPEMKLPQFTARIFVAYPFLLKGDDNASQLITRWREYKRSVPTYGAIICNKKLTHCILVQGSSEKSTWGFPKGKINVDELPEHCAAREVQEEIGYDISALIDKKDYIEQDLSGQINRLYIVRGVPLNTVFETQTRNEIRGIKWFEINNLPTHKKDIACKERLGMGAHNFFMVTPFAAKIKDWVAQQQPSKKIMKRRKRNQNESSEEDEDSIPPIHSIRTVVSRKSERRRRERKKNISPDSSDDETVDNANGQTKNQAIDQSPGAVKRLFHGGAGSLANTTTNTTNHQSMHQPAHEYGALPVKGSLIPSRTFNKMKTQRKQTPELYMPDAWKTFSFDRQRILAAMNS